MAGGPPSPAKRSFADVIGASASDACFIKRPSLHRGEPALIFTKSEVLNMSSGLKFALVGKFSRGRPPMAQLRKSFSTLDLKGSYQLGLLNYKHVLIRVDLEEDFLRLRLRKIMSFDGFAMRLFRWTPQFRLDVESTWVPIWVRFDGLPLYMFNKGALFSLGSILGDPLKIDASTTSLSRPSTARICVDIDIQKARPPRIWLEDGDRGFWQSVEYEDVPPLCSVCSKIGHLDDKCNQRQSTKISSTKQQWVPKLTEISKDADAVLRVINPEAAVSMVPNEAVVTEILLANPSSSSIQNATSTAFILAPSVDQPAAILSQAAHSVAAVLHSAPDVATAVFEVTDAAVLSAPIAEIAAAEIADAAAEIAAAGLASIAAISVPSEAADAAVLSAPIAENAAAEIAEAAAEVAEAAPPTAAPDSAVGLASIAAFSVPSDLLAVLPLNDTTIPTATFPNLDFVPNFNAIPSSAVSLGASPLVKESGPSLIGVLNPNAPLFNPQSNPYARFSKSFAEALLGETQLLNVSKMPLFFAVKSSEFPTFQMPQYAEFYTSSSFIPPDEATTSFREDIYTFSDGDDVPRWPASRELISASLKSFNKKIQAKLSMHRRFFCCPKHRKKWKKRAPISTSYPALSSSVPPPLNALTFQGPNPYEEHLDDNDSVEYESVWRSASSDEETSFDFTVPLSSEAALLALEFEDFSPPARRRYNKRFRDLPAPMTTRSFRIRS